MVIEKIYNNNVVLAIDDKTRKEVIITGCGIAFKKKVGQGIDEDKIEKTYIIQNPNFQNKVQQLAAVIKEEVFEASSKIIEYTEKVLDSELDEHIYIALTDHISFAIKRCSEGITIKNELLHEIKRVHLKEYKIGLWALKYIEKTLGVRLEEDEAGFIALHIVNANFKEEKRETILSTKIIDGILRIIKGEFNIEFNKNDMNYDRLLTHLRYFSKRIIVNKYLNNDSKGLIDIIMIKYPKEYDCALNIRKYIKEEFNYEVSDDEIIYLVLHIHRVVTVSELLKF